MVKLYAKVPQEVRGKQLMIDKNGAIYLKPQILITD
jgi:hypothetical protein